MVGTRHQFIWHSIGWLVLLVWPPCAEYRITEQSRRFRSSVEPEAVAGPLYHVITNAEKESSKLFWNYFSVLFHMWPWFMLMIGTVCDAVYSGCWIFLMMWFTCCWNYVMWKLSVVCHKSVDGYRHLSVEIVSGCPSSLISPASQLPGQWVSALIPF